MKHLKHFKINEKDLSYFTPMARWIASVWDKLDTIPEEKYGEFFDKLEDIYSMDIISIIDGFYSEDRLHYNQNGHAAEFIENFQDIKTTVDGILERDFGISDDTFNQTDKYNL